mmetsp:Transcript_7624/g.13751  ORF Transcript_7624/g.13751 Transcript_7624/m.13751 type:complete len:148 (-) Transcript_7624:68-511(-)
MTVKTCSAGSLCNSRIQPPLGPLKICGGCKSVQYCSSSCQHTHWKAHKKTCRLISSQILALKNQTTAPPLSPNVEFPAPPKNSTSEGQLQSLSSITLALSSAYPPTSSLEISSDSSDSDSQIISTDDIRRKMGGEGFVKFGKMINKN